jgi:hypothetical protein
MEISMINFDEEIKKFKPSMEVTEVEDAIVKNDVSDMKDIMLELLKSTRKEVDGYKSKVQ